jgi:hypothetical protein
MEYLSNHRGVIIKPQRGHYQTAEGSLSNHRGVIIKPQRGISNHRGEYQTKKGYISLQSGILSYFFGIIKLKWGI